jgi:hypothetical protein
MRYKGGEAAGTHEVTPIGRMGGSGGELLETLSVPMNSEMPDDDIYTRV